MLASGRSGCGDGAATVTCDPMRALIGPSIDFRRFGELVDGAGAQEDGDAADSRLDPLALDEDPHHVHERLDELLRVGEALLGLLLHEAHHDRLHLLGHEGLGGALDEGGDARRHVHPEESDLAVVVEGARPREHLVEHRPERVEVGARIDLLPERLLGGHVLRRAVDHPQLRQDLRRAARGRCRRLLAGQLTHRDLGDPEVEHLHEVGVGFALHEHHVLGLEVAVDDPERVRAEERPGDLRGDVERAAELEAPPGERVAERVPLDELEDEEERAVLELPEVRRRGHVGVVDVRRGHRFALEAGHHFRLAAHLGVKHLHREPLPHVGVLGFVHRAHTPLAEQAIDSVATAQHRADERRSARRGAETAFCCSALTPRAPPSETVDLCARSTVEGTSFINGPALS